MKIRITGVVQHNGHLLEQFEVYEINESDAKEMVKYGLAEEYTGDREAINPGDPVSRDKTPVDHYSAEVTDIDPIKKAELEKEGKLDEILNDDKPVILPTNEPELPVVTEEPETPAVEKKIEEVVDAPVQPVVSTDNEEVVLPAGPQTLPDDSVISKEE